MSNRQPWRRPRRALIVVLAAAEPLSPHQSRYAAQPAQAARLLIEDTWCAEAASPWRAWPEASPLGRGRGQGDRPRCPRIGSVCAPAMIGDEGSGRPG